MTYNFEELNDNKSYKKYKNGDKLDKLLKEYRTKSRFKFPVNRNNYLDIKI